MPLGGRVLDRTAMLGQMKGEFMRIFWFIPSYSNQWVGYARQFSSFQVCKMVGDQGLNRLATIAVAIIFLFGIFITSCTMKRGPMQPELNVFPQQVLIGDPIRIAVRGLSAGQNVSLNVNGKDQFGNTWSSNASFRAYTSISIYPSRPI